MKPRVRTVAAECAFAEVVSALLALAPGHDLYVLDRRGRYVGTVILERFEQHLAHEPELRTSTASELIAPDVEPVLPTLTLAQLARQFSRIRTERLPVVDIGRRLLGTVARIDLALHG